MLACLLNMDKLNVAIFILYRCKDVFSSLDALEQKHQAFERSRAREDADADRRLIHQSAADDDSEPINETFKRPTFTGKLIS